MRNSYWASKYQEVQRHANENNFQREWYMHEKHLLIFSWAGRPIFTRYGDETKLAAFVGVISAFVSNFQKTGDTLRAFFAGRYKFVFLFKGPVYMVCISRTPESVSQLQQQLAYAHDQIVSVLSSNAHSVLEERPNYDIRQLMGGTELLLHDIINEADRSPAHLFEATQCLRLNRKTRSKVQSALKRPAGKSKHVMHAILFAGGRLVHLVRGHKDRPLHVPDLHILGNFLTNSQSLRSSESWTPICLPRQGVDAFLYTYYLSPEVCLALLTADPSDFHGLRDARIELEAALSAKGVLAELDAAVTMQNWDVNEVGSGSVELRHFLYRAEASHQYVMTAPAEPYVDRGATDAGQRALFRRYQRVISRMRSGPAPHATAVAATPRTVALADNRHLMYFEVSDDATVLGYLRPGEFELYCTFLPLTSKEMALAASHRVLRWIKREEQSLFILP